MEEFIEGFLRSWEVRCFWFNGEFLYAMANRAAVSTAEGEKASIITGEDIPNDALQQAKRIGKEALKSLPELTTPAGHPIGMTCVRTDVGCADSPVHDKDYAHWNASGRTFFLNEIEYGGTTYFARALKFDCIPLWAELYVAKAREINQKMGKHEGNIKIRAVTGAASTVDSLGSFEGCSSRGETSDSD